MLKLDLILHNITGGNWPGTSRWDCPKGNERCEVVLRPVLGQELMCIQKKRASKFLAV